jgi:hypothetical protein
MIIEDNISELTTNNLNKFLSETFSLDVKNNFIRESIK